MKTITLETPEDFLDWREVPGGAVEIVNITVGTRRGEGRGRRLVNLLIERVKGSVRLVFARTRQGNVIAQEFYTAIGFRFMGRLEAFYEGEDAFVYGYDLEG